jgi:formylglycine-generating enzyme required for sulfatase activity
MDRSAWALAALIALAIGVAGPARAESSGQAPLPGETFRDCGDCTELVVVPPGEFDMGSSAKPTEQPLHHVALRKSFAMGRREVTFADWDRCVEAGGCKFNPPDQGLGRGQRPVTNVSWDDAKQFLAWLSKATGKSYRLPTEAEWEYAARGGSTTPFWWGKDVGTARAQCMDCGVPAPGWSVPVASFRPNAFGLYDTAGNAAEWVEDCWNPTYRGAPNDGSAG